MHTKLEQFGKELKDNLLKEVSNNHRKIEEKLNQAMSGNMSYADKVINADPPWRNISCAEGNHGLSHNNEGSQK